MSDYTEFAGGCADGEKLRRFVVFGYLDYYPSGGSGDVVMTCDDLAVAKAWIAVRQPPQLSGYQALAWANNARIAHVCDRYELFDCDARAFVDV